MSATHKVKIAARLRPRIDGELDDDSVKVYSASEPDAPGCGSFITVTNPRDPTQLFKFPFTSCYGQSSTQEEIFKNDVEPLIDVVYSGVTVTIFAYGVTSSGKTHTMQGTKADPGVIPRVVRAIFQKSADFRQYKVSFAVSYMEIYKDDVYDLLVTRENAPKLPVRENDAGMVFVANLKKEELASIEEFDNIYTQATKHRSVGSTNLNRASSRSHAVLTLEVTLLDVQQNKTLTGKINLVDLAGSENNKLTGNDPSRMAESSAINKSLSVLGQVVHALNQGAPRIPYRNSKLTRLLQDALGGSSVGLLICNLAPGIKFRQDTLNTLNFAVRTKNVENKPVVNERDNRPAVKPHFAAVPVGAPAPKPVLLPQNAAGPSRARPSLVPVPRIPRVSAFGGFQSFTLPGLANVPKSNIDSLKEEEQDRSGSFGTGLSEKEIDERISKAVEAEVTRRLAEREQEREREDRERQSAERDFPLKTNKSNSPRKDKEQTLPSGVLTPLLKRQRDEDDALKTRLHELERKFERENKEVQLADVLSPVSKKKTGRAYVALARAHSEKGDLQVALDLYRKAESYVPDNVKLKERIIEIEWAVKNNKEFVPSPKPAKRTKSKKQRQKEAREQRIMDEKMEIDEVADAAQGFQAMEFGFGAVLTNTDSPNKSKRSLADRDDEEAGQYVETPIKRQRCTEVADARENVDGEIIPPTPIRRSNRHHA